MSKGPTETAKLRTQDSDKRASRLRLDQTSHREKLQI